MVPFDRAYFLSLGEASTFLNRHNLRGKVNKDVGGYYLTVTWKNGITDYMTWHEADILERNYND